MAAFHTFPARLTPEPHPLGDSGLRLLPMEYSESAYRRRFLPGAAAGSQAGFASSSSSIRGGTGLTGAVSSSTSSAHKDPLVRAASLAPTAPRKRV